MPSNSPEVVLEYFIGASRVRIVRYDDEYVYEVSLEPKPPEDLVQKIRKCHELILTSLPLKHVVDESDIVRVVREVLEVPSELIPVALHMIKKELKYKILQELIEDPYIEDITIVGPGPVWIRHKKVLEINPHIDFIRTNIVISSYEEVLELQKYLAEKAGVHISASTPIIEAQLPEEDGGHRVHIVGPEVAGRRPEITIRKKVRRNLELQNLISQGVLTSIAAAYLYLILRARGSVIIAGPPGSGKTTLLQALLDSFIPRSWKVVIIEDTPELDVPVDSNWVKYVTYETGRVRIDQFILAKAALRASGNRLLVVGETRGSEAQVLTQAMNLGMGVLTTFHGGSAEEVIIRFKSPPINLTDYQLRNIWCIVLMGFIDKGAKFSRGVIKISEVVPSNGIEVVDVFMRDNSGNLKPTTVEEVIRRSYRLRNVMERLSLKPEELQDIFKEFLTKWSSNERPTP